MANVQLTRLPIIPSLELYITHWKYWNNYSDSTVLVDPSYNIIAFYDNKTENIDTIMTDIPVKEKFIIANWVGIKTKEYYKYIPLLVADELKKHTVKIKELKSKPDELKKFYESINKQVWNRNINYFTNFIKEL